MAKCKEHDWKIEQSFHVDLRAIRKYVCTKCGAAKYTAQDGGNEYEISAALFNDYWKDYLNNR